jgi:hypothetical protein
MTARTVAKIVGWSSIATATWFAICLVCQLWAVLR